MMKYPIAEEFDSIQGEGFWTGSFMRFIRLAGCNVGKWRGYHEDNLLIDVGTPLQILKDNKHHTMCTLWDGKVMLCDTDYHMSYKKTPDELLKDIGKIEHVCITGGEPFMHDLNPLIEACQDRNLDVHIETSGTLPFKLDHDKLTYTWITCAPKEGFLKDTETLAYINEYKILIYPNTTRETLQEFLEGIDPYMEIIYLQPVTNLINEHDQRSVQRCIELIRQEPRVRLSAQLHKYIGER